MSDLESWIVRATVGALVAALAGIFVRLRVLESKRAAADVRIKAQEDRRAPDYSAQLKQIDDRLRALETRVGSGKSTTEIWNKVDGLARSLSHTDQSVGELRGTIGEMRSLVHSINNHLRGGGAR
ncbi:MAG: hypothetical protein OXK73_12305 [Rhodospirillaceae bacterium]|nr:hypothetical protein [Rhodospirillaceae bacterium]